MKCIVPAPRKVECNYLRNKKMLAINVSHTYYYLTYFSLTLHFLKKNTLMFLLSIVSTTRFKLNQIYPKGLQKNICLNVMKFKQRRELVLFQKKKLETTTINTELIISLYKRYSMNCYIYSSNGDIMCSIQLGPNFSLLGFIRIVDFYLIYEKKTIFK